MMEMMTNKILYTSEQIISSKRWNEWWKDEMNEMWILVFANEYSSFM